MHIKRLSMKLSVITINRNNADGLERTIKSVIAIKYPDLEYIVVDGASTDNSIYVIQKYESHITHWISEPDSGIYNAMNKAVKFTSGEYLFFLNSGDLFIPSCSFDFLNNATADFIFTSVIMYNNNIRIKSTPPKHLNRYDFYEGMCHQATIIKRRVFMEQGKYDEDFRIIADWGLLIKAICINRCSYATVRKVLVKYNTQGISSQAAMHKNILEERKTFDLKYKFHINKYIYYLYRLRPYILTRRIYMKISHIINSRNKHRACNL